MATKKQEVDKVKDLADQAAKRALVRICYNNGMGQEDVLNLIDVLKAGTNHDFKIEINKKVKEVGEED